MSVHLHDVPPDDHGDAPVILGQGEYRREWPAPTHVDAASLLAARTREALAKPPVDVEARQLSTVGELVDWLLDVRKRYLPTDPEIADACYDWAKRLQQEFTV